MGTVYRVKVHKKGLIVIPAEVRRSFGIREGMFLDLVVDDNCIKIVPPKSLVKYFGCNGEKGLEVVRLIHESRRVEIEKEASI